MGNKSTDCGDFYGGLFTGIVGTIAILILFTIINKGVDDFKEEKLRQEKYRMESVANKQIENRVEPWAQEGCYFHCDAKNKKVYTEIQGFKYD